MSDTALEAADVVGRFEAEQEIPEQMRADVRLLGELLGQVLRESGSPELYDDVERLRAATIQAYTDETDRGLRTGGSGRRRRSRSSARTRSRARSPPTSTS